ncbi:MAG: MotA/TolQ/ExbB proton channel family protein [Planctomycetaceae bacterium]
MSYVLRDGSLPNPQRTRLWTWGALCFGLLMASLVSIWSSHAQAFQDEAEKADAEAPAAEEGEADADAEGKEGAAAEGEDDAPVDNPQTMLSWFITASGPFGFMIFVCSFIMVALIVMNLLAIRRDSMLPPSFLEAFEQKLNAKDYQGAYELAKNDGSVVSRVLAAGLSRLNRGYDDALEGMHDVGTDENMALEHRLSYLAMIGSIAPMLGLLGTVQGMIAAFAVIANSTSQPKPSELAQGIMMALVTTLEGLVVAIPAIVFFGFMKNRSIRFMFEIGMISEGLMNRFSTVGRGASSTTTTATQTTPA